MSEYTQFQDELMHHGVKGMHWGIRRFQNEDGSLTRKGKRRLGKTQQRLADIEGLAQRVSKMETKAARRYRLGENIHARQKLGFRGRLHTSRARRYAVRAAKRQKKADRVTNPEYKSRLEEKAAYWKFKSSRSDRIAKSEARRHGYSNKSEKWMRRGDKFQNRADKAKFRIQQNKHYAEVSKRILGPSVHKEINAGEKKVRKFLKLSYSTPVLTRLIN